MSHGAQEILDERIRQQSVEGYTAAHDAAHGPRPLMEAAAAYLLKARGVSRQTALFTWPWLRTSFKPTTRRRDLVKAGALIAAAIDAIDAKERS